MVGCPQQRIAVVADGAALSGIVRTLACRFTVENLSAADAPTMLVTRAREFAACVIDADLRDGAGLVLVESIATTCPGIAVLLFASLLRRETVAIASRLGVPLLVDPFSVTEVDDALAGVRRRALAYVERELRAEFEATAKRAGLTDKQESVSMMIVLGAVSKQVADRLGVKLRTVEGHRHEALRKLHVGTMDDFRWRLLSRVLPDWRGQK